MTTGDKKYKETLEMPPSECGCTLRHWVVLYYEGLVLKARYCTTKDQVEHFKEGLKYDT